MIRVVAGAAFHNTVEDKESVILASFSLVFGWLPSVSVSYSLMRKKHWWDFIHNIMINSISFLALPQNLPELSLSCLAMVPIIRPHAVFLM